MPAAADEIVLAPTTAKELHVSTGGTVKLVGGGPPQVMKVSGVGFVPTGPHNSYDTGAWLTPAGYQRIFRGSHYAFKFHLSVVSLRPGSNVAAAAQRLTGEAAKVKGGQAFPFTPQQVALPQVQALRDVAVLPLALAAFLGLLAVAAVGYALSIAVRRRRHELAVLRALGRTVWRAATGMVPLAYHTPAALWALVLIAPVALVVANLLAGWPGRRAARLHTGQILRTE
jgi:ABC-type antimicrobial peptide transport system permease subunit